MGGQIKDLVDKMNNGLFDEKLYDYWINKFFSEDTESYVIDAGCGKGFFHKYLKDKGYNNVIGIDCNEEYIKYAKRFNGFKYILYDLQDILNINCDVVISQDVLEHVDSPYNYIRNICNMADIVYISTPNALRVEWEGYTKFHRDRMINDTARQYFTPVVIKKIFKRFGFSCIFQNKLSRIGISHIYMKFKKTY
jgi:2-polyprenyl-3-methyl-5-hydroxy-6-metoxy-1,4-benzoquinol methylase